MLVATLFSRPKVITVSEENCGLMEPYQWLLGDGCVIAPRLEPEGVAGL